MLPLKMHMKEKKREWQNYLENRNYIRDTKIPEKIPVIILSATELNFYTYHKELINTHKKSLHLKIEGSHALHHEKPDLIIKYIQKLISIR
jgi:hypothetical protein